MSQDALDRIDLAFRRVVQTIWIVTAQDGARRGGLVATWAGRASIDAQRPVAMAAIADNHFTRQLIDGSQAFALHLISAEQAALAWRFGIGSGNAADKLEGVPHEIGESGSPILRDCLAWFDCRVFARYAAGERICFWADVLDAASISDANPMTDHALFALASDEQQQQLRSGLQADVEQQAPLHQAWRKMLR
jgi:flavin reductase (DIM6/NTAB) family NADH-FMN oxidoreductase RutF